MIRCDRPTVIAKLALAAGLLLIVTPRAIATETAVGLEAQGVDPNAALNNPQGLDVRDELGRPVSAAVIRAQLKEGQAEAASQAAYVSTLPQASRVVKVLELLAALPMTLGRAVESALARLFADASLPRPAQRLPAALILAFFFALVRCRSSRAVLTRSLSVPAGYSVLRC